MEQLFEQFIRTGLYLRGWSTRTVRTYRQGFSSLHASLGEAAITKESLEAWVIGLREKGLFPGGINMYIRTINSFLSWLKEEGVIQQSLRMKLLPNPCKPLKGFSDIEIRSLLSFRPRGFTELRTWTLLQFLLDTGCRIEEVLGAPENKIDLENLTVTVHGKGNKVRLVPISFEFRKVLFRYLQLKRSRVVNGSQSIFSTSSGHRLSYRNTYRDIKNLCAKAGVEGKHVHPHGFRHAFAVCYIRRGGDIYRLSRILGHTSISTTQIYLRSMGIDVIAEGHSSLSPLSKF